MPLLHALLYAISDYNINRLQQIQNSTAHTMTNTRTFQDVINNL